MQNGFQVLNDCNENRVMFEAKHRSHPKKNSIGFSMRPKINCFGCRKMFSSEVKAYDLNDSFEWI